MGFGAVELTITVEELGRVADPTPFLVTTSQYVPAIRHCGDPDQRRRLLEAVCAGGTGAATFEADGLLAQRDGDDWILEGTAHHVMDGDRADELALTARTDSGVGVFVVPAGDAMATRLPSFDATLHVADVRVDGVRVGAGRSMVGPTVAAGLDRARQESITALA